MFPDKETKEIPEGGFMRPGDEIISIREVCLADKLNRKDLGLHLVPSSSKNDPDESRSPFRDGFFSEGFEHQARFVWTEEDGNIASLVSEPGFGTTGQTTFGEQIDSAFKTDMKEADTLSSALRTKYTENSYGDSQQVTSTSSVNSESKSKSGSSACKVDKKDPRSRCHFVIYVKRNGKTVKLWECGICGREFQHQYTLMRHLPTHTDERNYHCSACGKSFRQLSTLSQHKAIHSSDRPYSCEVCKKTFNRVSTLISHRKTHLDEKPYRCHLCPKGFHQKGNLRNHLFTHTNERPYRCNICMKGFNQQSNLVCHKNKAHPEDGTGNVVRRNIIPRPRPAPEPKLDNNRSQISNCEVSSSVDITPSGWHKPVSWELSSMSPESSSEPWNLMSGVVVDAIKTYHMEVATATKQTPFALLKPDDGTPVLVKVVDTSLPGGKQMLVPATAEDLRSGGKIEVKKEENENSAQKNIKEPHSEVVGAVQIRVPVVATVIPKIKPGGRLHLSVEEPHRAYHTTLSKDWSVASSSCSLPPPPSPPLDLIPLDLFEPIECMPLGPQVTAVDIVDHPPPSDDSDIFIGEFEEGIPLSDSE